MKLLVAHFSPDLDAIGAVWVLKRFDAQTYADAHLAFVNPGTTIDIRAAADMGFSEEEITHVDTGLGEFDHHQADRGKQDICATTLVFEYVKHLHPELENDRALAYIASYVNDIDHFAEQSWKNASDPKNQFLIQNLIDGARGSVLMDDEATVHFGMTCLDAAYHQLHEQYEAQSEIEEKGKVSDIGWGKLLAIESANDEVIKLAQKQGFDVVVRKDPTYGHIRIKAVPGKSIDLTPVYERILKADTVGKWYFHPAKTMLLNGSNKARDHVASPLTLTQVVEIITEAAKS